MEEKDTGLIFRKHLERFVKITDDELEELLTYFKIMKLKKGELLIKPGKAVTTTYWVKKGLLISSFTDVSTDKEHIVQFALENCWITDQDAFYNQTMATFSIVCRENSELLALSFKDREKLCEKMPMMQKFFLKKANDSFVKQQKRMLTYLTSDAKQRFDLLQEEYPGLFQRLPKKVLAAYLGVRSETLSRLGMR